MCVDYDPPDVFREDTRRAVTAHRCGECGRTIHPGEHYQSAAGLTDGYWWSAKQCAQCHAAGRWLVTICNGYLFNDVLDELVEHLDEPPPISSVPLGRLVVRMRKRWRRRDGSLWPPEDVKALVDRALTPWRDWQRAERERKQALLREAAHA